MADKSDCEGGMTGCTFDPKGRASMETDSGAKAEEGVVAVAAERLRGVAAFAEVGAADCATPEKAPPWEGLVESLRRGAAAALGNVVIAVATVPFRTLAL